jgi:hypothetical protein
MAIKNHGGLRKVLTVGINITVASGGVVHLSLGFASFLGLYHETIWQNGWTKVVPNPCTVGWQINIRVGPKMSSSPLFPVLWST